MADFGKHFLVELIGCNFQLLKYKTTVRPILLDAAEKSNAHIVNYSFHQFKPFGVSGVILIAESHFSIHTWPEHAYAAVDIFTCGQEMNPDIAIRVLSEKFNPQKVKISSFLRGFDTRPCILPANKNARFEVL